MNTIRLGENVYPYHINWQTLENWENETGKEMQDILDILNAGKTIPSGKDIVLILKLCFFAVQTGCKKNTTECLVTMDEFIENSEIADLGKYMEIVAKGLNLEEQKGNKRQPKQSV